MKRVCVFAGSSPGRQPDYADAARALGRELAEREWELGYGGAYVGLMGTLAAIGEITTGSGLPPAARSIAKGIAAAR